MAFLALGTGFVNAANERQKENRDERRETRKLAMEVWMKDTLPRVRASRAKDDAAVGRMNTLMADSFYKGQPGLAFYATKWMDQSGKDEAAFREHVATNQIPEELKAQQQKELQNHFNFDTNTNSFSWKDLGSNGSGGQAPGAAMPGAEGRKPSFYDKIMGTGNEAQDINKGVSTVAKAAGVDPNAPTTSRFDSINLPGSFDTKDPEKERLKAEGRAAFARNPDLVRNYGEFASAMASGDSKKVETLMTNPKFTISREEAKADKFNQAFKMSAMEGYLRGDFGKDNDLFKAIIQGNSEKIIEGVSKGLKTDEQKLAQAEKLKKIELTYGSLDSPEAFLMMRKSGLLAGIDIPEANLALMEAQARQSILEKQDLNTRLVLATTNKGKDPEEQVTMDDLAAVGPKTPATAPVDIKEVEAAINAPEGMILKSAQPEANSADKAAKILQDEEALNSIAERAPPELIRSQRDPVKLLQAATRSTSDKTPPGRASEIARNLTLTPEVVQRIISDEDYGNEWEKLMTSQVEPYLEEFGSMADAQAAVHPFGLAKVRGNIVVVPPKKQ
jgi:hypothetical protein